MLHDRTSFFLQPRPPQFIYRLLEAVAVVARPRAEKRVRVERPYVLRLRQVVQSRRCPERARRRILDGRDEVGLLHRLADRMGEHADQRFGLLLGE